MDFLNAPRVAGTSPQLSEWSNMATDHGCCGYFHDSTTHITRRQSQNETPSIPTGLASRIPSTPPPCAGRGSNRSSETVDTNFLSPPVTPGELEDLPYKPCCPSSESLKMSRRCTEEHRFDGHKHKVKKRRSKEKRKRLTEAPLQKQETCGNHPASCNGFPESQSKTATTIKPKDSINQLEVSAERIAEINRKAMVPEDDSQGCSLPSRLRRTDTVKTRWGSVDIGAKVMPETKIQTISAESKATGIEHLPHSYWMKGHRESDINKAVRERLKKRRTFNFHPPPPASITLSKPKSISLDEISGLMPTTDMNNVAMRQSEQVHRCYGVISNPISIEDIDSMIKSIRPGFQKMMSFDNHISSSNRDNTFEGNPRKPSLTDRGVLPQPNVAATHATSVDIVRRPDSVPHVTFGDMRRPSLQPRWSSRAVIKTPRASITEIIWEGNQYLCSSTPSTTGISDEAIFSSLSPDASVKSYGSGLKSGMLNYMSHLPAVSPKEQSPTSSQGDISPSSRVSQWVLGDRALQKISDISPSQSLSQVTSQTPDADGEIPSDDQNFRFADLPDVFSFPPLPSRQDTNQWISPLPDISAPEFSVAGGRVSKPSIELHMDTPSTRSNAPHVEIRKQEAPEAKVHSHNDALSSGTQTLRRHQIANLPYQQPLAHIWESVKPGSAIGFSSGARRKSSAHSIHITIDEAGLKHRSTEEESAWTKPRKDSGWPVARTPSPAELSSKASSSKHVS